MCRVDQLQQNQGSNADVRAEERGSKAKTRRNLASGGGGPSSKAQGSGGHYSLWHATRPASHVRFASTLPFAALAAP